MGKEAAVHSSWVSGTERAGRADGASLLFPYWSFTKTVIAICALKLVERKEIDLDAPMDGAPYTLRNLLSHTAGLPDYGSLPEYHAAVQAGDDPWLRERLLEAVAAKGPLFAPDRGWSYSNIGYMLARERIEQASGREFSDLLKELICDPLGLDTVELAVSRDRFSRVVWPAARDYHPGWVYHGCLIGSANDAVRLLHALFSGEVLGNALLEQMLVRRPLGGAIEGRPWTSCGYGLGIMSGTMGEAGRAIGHSGGGPFSTAAVYHFPDRNAPITVAVFTDGGDAGMAEFEAARLSLAV